MREVDPRQPVFQILPPSSPHSPLEALGNSALCPVTQAKMDTAPYCFLGLCYKTTEGDALTDHYTCILYFH